MKQQNSWLNKKPQTILDWLGLIVISVALYLLLGNLDVLGGAVGKFLDVAAPFASGIVLAYVLDCLVRPVWKYLFRRSPKLHWLAILIAYAAAVLIVVFLIYLVVPQVVASVTALLSNLPAYINNGQNFLLELQARYGVDLTAAIEMLDSYESVMNRLTSALKDSAPQVMAYVGSIASNVVDVFTAVASSVYMLAEKDKLLHQLRTLVHAFFPRPVAETILETCTAANQNFEGFFGGKIIDSVIIGVLTFVCCAVLGIDFAPLIAVVIGVANIIPVLGLFLGTVPCLVILLFASPFDALKFLILIAAIQQLDTNVIAPRILGKSVGVSALWALVAIIIGGGLLGPVGMVLGVPVFATVYGLARQFAFWCLQRRGINADGTPRGSAGEPSDRQAAQPEPTAAQSR